MTDKLKLTNRLMRMKDRSQAFHSSGYAQAQNRGSFGAASTESFSERRKIDENRKFVRGYNNARVISDAYAFERVRSYVPRTESSGVTGVRTGGAPTPPMRKVASIRSRLK